MREPGPSDPRPLLWADFLAEDPRRSRGEVTFGRSWLDPAGGPPWSVLWLLGTAELVAVQRVEPAVVEPLGVFAHRAQVEAALEGWWRAVQHDATLDWVRGAARNAHMHPFEHHHDEGHGYGESR